MPAAFDYAGPFKEGRAVVLAYESGGKFFGFIDSNGEWAVKPQFNLARDFANTFAVVRTRDWGAPRWGHIHADGQIAVLPRFESAGDFADELAPTPVANGRDRVC